MSYAPFLLTIPITVEALEEGIQKWVDGLLILKLHIMEAVFERHSTEKENLTDPAPFRKIVLVWGLSYGTVWLHGNGGTPSKAVYGGTKTETGWQKQGGADREIG